MVIYLENLHLPILALGIITAGMGLGQMLLPLLAAHLIVANGWRIAYIIMAAMVLVIVISAAIPARRSPQDMALPPNGKNRQRDTIMRKAEFINAIETKEWSSQEAVRTLAFWLFVTPTYPEVHLYFGAINKDLLAISLNADTQTIPCEHWKLLLLLCFDRVRIQIETLLCYNWTLVTVVIFSTGLSKQLHTRGL